MPTMVAIAERYEYIEELGQGSRGRVVACLDRSASGRPVALKLVRPEHLPGLLWEMERLRQLSAPQLAQVHALHVLEQAAPVPFVFPRGSGVLVQQRAEGQTALVTGRARRGQAGLLPFVHALARDALLALRQLHAAGFVHRDVKPDNLVVDSAGRAMLVDLELVAPVGPARELSGSLAYAGPEAWAGQLTPALDVYALGATLFDVLRGEAPAAASTAASHRPTGPFVPRVLDELPPSVPGTVRSLLASFMEPDPARRPDDAAAALVQLDACAEAFGATREPALLDWASGRAPAEDAAARAGRLPWTGSREPVEQLRAAIEAGGPVQVVGPPGAGRSRLVREAVLSLQLERARAGAAAPVYERAASGDLGAVEGRVVHVDRLEPVALEVARGACEAAALDGSDGAVVFEVHTALPDVPAVSLAPLDRAGVAGLLAAAFGERPADALVEAAHAACQGRAGDLCRRLAELTDRDPLDPASWSATASAGAWTEGLPATAAVWLAALALWDVPVDAESLGHPGLAPALAAELGRRIEARGHWVHAGTRVSLRPALARALRAELSPAERHEALDALRAALGGLPGDAPWLQSGPARTRGLLERARSLRARGAVAQAEALLEEGCEAGATPELRRAWADALRAGGRYTRALEVLDAPDDAAGTLQRAELERLAGLRDAARERLRTLVEAKGEGASQACALLSRMASDAGDGEQARAWLSRCADPGPDDADAVLALCEARARAASGEQAERAADDFFAAAVRFGSARHQARASSLRAGLRPAGDGRARAEWLAAQQVAAGLGEAHEAASYAFNLGLARLDAGELGGALSMLREGARGFARLRRPAELGRVLFNWANAWLLMGEHVLAERVLVRAETESGRVGDGAALALCAVVRAELSVREGAPQRALEGLERALVEAPVALRSLLAARLVFVLASLDRVDDAQAVLASHAQEEQGEGDVELSLAHVRLALARGQAREAEQRVQPLLSRVQREASFETRMRALLLGAEVARAGGDGTRAGERLSRCRMLLDAAMRGLTPGQQTRLRAVEQYARALDALPSGQVTEQGEEPRLQRLLAALPRLFRAEGPGAVGEVMCELALELVPAERALWIVREPDGERVRARAGAVREGGESHSASVVGQAWASGQIVSARDAVTDARFASAASVHALALRSVVAVPMRAAGAHAVLYVEDSLRPAAFREADQRCIRELARAGEGALLVAAQREREREARREAEARAQALTTRLEQQGGPGDLEPVGTSAELRACLHLADRVAGSDLSVLITGESGAGKELIARRIHRRSPRHDRPFVAENCAALPETLLESALFGHVRGAFTGATKDHRGLFEQAHDGTLFLDEIGEMSAGMQAKLLRVLESGEVRPVGGQRERTVNVRVLAATHRDLERDVSEGRFREDLFYRIAVVQIAVPPLRERREDIAALARHFLSLHGRGRAVRIAPRALVALQQREFRGNVRELENVVRRALVLADDVIDVEHVAEPDRPAAVDALDLHAQVEALQRRLVREALAKAEGNQTRAAELLGISRYGLQKMLKRLAAS